jgi:hypothetical protein
MTSLSGTPAPFRATQRTKLPLLIGSNCVGFRAVFAMADHGTLLSNHDGVADHPMIRRRMCRRTAPAMTAPAPQRFRFCNDTGSN